jgi:hypothetical protein
MVEALRLDLFGKVELRKKLLQIQLPAVITNRPTCLQGALLSYENVSLGEVWPAER